MSMTSAPEGAVAQSILCPRVSLFRRLVIALVRMIVVQLDSANVGEETYFPSDCHCPVIFVEYAERSI